MADHIQLSREVTQVPIFYEIYRRKYLPALVT